MLSRKYLSQLISNMRNAATAINVVEDTFISGLSFQCIKAHSLIQLASDIVDWLVSEQSAEYTLEQALSVGQQLMESKLLIPLDVACKDFRIDSNMWFTFEEWTPKEVESTQKATELRSIFDRLIECILFNLFLDQTRQGHLLQFWIAVEGLRGDNVPRLEEKLKAVVETYIEGSGPSRINFCTSNVIDLLGTIGQKNEEATSHLLKFLFAAQTEVFDRMNNSYFQRYTF